VISRIRPKKFVVSLVVMAAALYVAPFAAAQSNEVPEAPATAASLDFEFFKTRVEPIFLKKREGHARCYSCHSGGGAPAYLVKLSPGATFWTDEQSRTIFRRVSTFVVLGKPDESYIVMHPLAPEAGGDTRTGFHGGGRQFRSKDDPDWQTLVQWVSGAKAAGPSASN
jgi:hypothetical protein